MSAPQHRRFSIFHTLATLGITMLIAVCVVMGGAAGFINYPSLMITLGIPFFLLLGNYGRDYLRFIPDSLLTLFTKPPAPNSRFAEIAVLGSRYVVGAGVTGTLIGIIQMLRNTYEPSTIGSGMAVSLITVLYAVVVSEFVMAFLAKAYSEGELLPVQARSNRSMVLVISMVIGVVALCFLTIVAFHPADEQIDMHSRSLFSMSAFEVNPSGAESIRVLRFTPCLVLSDECLANEIVSREIFIRDRVLQAVRQESCDELAAQDGRDRLKSVVINSVNEVLAQSATGSVTDVYFTEYVLK